MTPRFFCVEQVLETAAVEDVPRAAREAAAALAGPLRPGAKVALACGSRGIASLGEIAAAAAASLRALGHHPFVVPAMGSHGGATASGQRALLADLGVTEASVGAPIVATMEVEQVAATPDGVPLYMDRAALGADGVIAVNRIKPHTTLRGELGSGLMKMICVGLGNHEGARTLHAAGLQDHLLSAARAILARAPVLGGIAIVENGEGRVACLEAVPAAAIPERDRALLAVARRYMPGLPIDPLDVLVVRWMGKDVSGTGMDPNVVGLHRRQGGPPDRHIATLVALDLTGRSHGNATGVGMADLVTHRLRDKIDWEVTRTNCLTGGFEAGLRLPSLAADDREALRAAAALHGQPLRAAIVQDTLHLKRLWLSEALRDEAARAAGLRILGEPFELEFRQDGSLLLPDHGAGA
ncbi:MAG TPA: hypothetical protein VIG99_00975 [Myxococcaceae bacterium]|jgi:hypothetical protein